MAAQERAARERAAQRTISKYQVEAELGAGAFGRVFKCYDPELDRHVAIKVLRDELLTAADRDQFVRDFQNEARAAAKVKHQFVCEIYEVGVDRSAAGSAGRTGSPDDDGRPFLVMPFIESGTLRHWMAANPLPPAAVVLSVVRDIALGLDAAHRKGIVHRDVKPANVLWDEESKRVLVTDFGLAKLVDTTVTVSVYKGTPLYMSPEQWRPGKPHKVGPASDVYGLGVMLFQLLTGTFPFGLPDGDPLGYGMTVCMDDPRSPSAVLPHLDPQFDSLVLKALAKSPADRYASAKVFADALDEARRVAEDAERRQKAEATMRSQVEAVYQEGRSHYRGLDVPRNYAKAREFFERAAAQGHASAQHDLGFLYHYGHGTTQDYAKACSWYEKAASQGHADAQYILGAMYLGGYGVKKDAARARAWFEKAAAQGHVPAKAALKQLPPG